MRWIDSDLFELVFPSMQQTEVFSVYRDKVADTLRLKTRFIALIHVTFPLAQNVGWCRAYVVLTAIMLAKHHCVFPCSSESDLNTVFFGQE
ncbi:hypothetical protein A3767_20480 [Oleiphilus sp. HI0133]|nr:hypothetical protein A3767_20480 [Oleiphilus sp. HI0133]